MDWTLALKEVDEMVGETFSYETRTFASQFAEDLRAETPAGTHSLAGAPREQIGYQDREEDAQAQRLKERETERDRQTHQPRRRARVLLHPRRHRK
jgi:hypothetical protein